MLICPYRQQELRNVFLASEGCHVQRRITNIVPFVNVGTQCHKYFNYL